MPELKRLFLKGRMNKDLDERLVPNGEYRDALNIQIGSSEGSDVGAIENILGNTVGNKKRQGPLQYWELDSASTNYYGLPKDAKCIGGVKDDINDRIYWFVHSSEVDCIVEYDNQYGVVRPVLVDDFTTNGTRILNFEFNKLITGVNILDNYLFFTDDNSEPKKVNVTRGVFSSSDFTTHSTYKGRGFIESDITVIKKSPLTAPSLTLSSDERGGNSITTTLANFNFIGNESGGISESKPIGASVTFYVNPNIEVNYRLNDIIKLTAFAPSSHPQYYTYEIEIDIYNFPYGTNEITGYIVSIPPEIQDLTLSWDIELVQNDPIFETKFPRFAYRWKYHDNQYSCFSPFTEVAFLPGVFNFNSKTGYNEGMNNNIRKIDLEITEAAPVNVKEIDILYKQSNNSSVYVVETLSANNFSLLENLSDISVSSPLFFTITNELIYKIVESNQLLRPWDNVPRLAKAQEIVGNRLLYGNYLQNYSWNNELIGLNSSIKSENLSNESILGLPSIKSLRTYQVGVVFKDEYGRETPVFTNKQMQHTLGITYSNKQNKLRVSQSRNFPEYPPPVWATHYKYFVKESNNKYYNLATDRIYFTEDPQALWVAFPSSERNKVAEDDYLILKKGSGSSQAISTSNKYKILAIENTAPEAIKKTKKLQYDESIDFSTSFPASNLATSKATGFTPDDGSKTFVINAPSAPLLNALQKNKYIRFSSVNNLKSNYYKVTEVNPAASNATLKVYLDKPFSTDVLFMYNSSNQITSDILEIFDFVDKDTSLSIFEGNFFVKINGDGLLLENIGTGSEFVQYNSSTFFDDQYSSSDPIIFGSGVPRGAVNVFTTPGTEGGYTFGTNGSEDPDLLTLTGPWDLILEWDTWNTDVDFFHEMNQIGTKLRFTGARFRWDPNNLSGDDTIYQIEDVYEYGVYEGSSTQYKRLYIRLRDSALPSNIISDPVGLKSWVNPSAIVNDPIFSESSYSVSIELLKEEETFIDFSSNPAIFETEAKEQVDLDIYYEASDALDISTYGDTYVLNWSNCFTFGNGVESNRIRDDYNNAFIDTGTKASTILDEPYEEERRATGIIYSGIYNSNSGLNNLNQFIQAEKITKDLNPIYGSIQKLHTRDTNLVTFCEDKVLRILANKDALYNADGNANVTSTNNVLGQAVPFAGEFGISKNPESFASYGFRAYFSDKKRGAMLRLSIDGLTDISSKGMTDYFWDNLKNATTVLGNYDVYSDCYTVTLNNDTVCFDEKADGWPTRKSFIPEFGVSLNAEYYTMSNGMIWKHDNETRNTFYEEAAEKSSVQLIFNDNPNNIKNFKTLSYEGSSGWTAPLIETDQQNGAVTTFLDKENIYYNYIRGLDDTWNNFNQTGTLDLKQFAAQGIGNLSSVDSYTGNTTFKIVVKNDPADAETTYTVTEYDAEAEVGEQVSLSITEFSLIITPNAGYTIDAASFSVPVLPTEINSAVFTNGVGGTVKVTCTFDPTFIMPLGDVEILLDIDGVATEDAWTISGNLITTESNTTGTSGTTPFSVSGNEGDEVTLFTKTFTVASNHIFNITPFYYQDPAQKTTNNYIITYSGIGVGVGKDYLFTEITYTAKYIIGSSDQTLNDIYFIAEADPIFTSTAELFSYKINTNDIGQKPESRVIDFTGGAGAGFNLNVTDGGAINDNYALNLPASGTKRLTLDFPNNLAPGDKTWTFTLTGDLASPFTQANPFTITQLGT